MITRVGLRRIALTCVAVGTVAVCVSTVSADTMWMANDNGSNERFGWSGGAYGGVETTGHFGSPEVDANGFHFSSANSPDPLAIRAQVGASPIGDYIDVFIDVNAADPDPADPLTTITIFEWGRWFGPSGDNLTYDVYVTPSTTLIDIPSAESVTHGSDEFVVTYYPVVGDEGLWTAEYTYVVDALADPPENHPWEDIQLTVHNTLYSFNADSWIEKDGMDIIVPEPASVLLLLAGFGPLMLRRSRR